MTPNGDVVLGEEETAKTVVDGGKCGYNLVLFFVRE